MLKAPKFIIIHAQTYNYKNDGIQRLVETSPRIDPWSAERLVGEIMGVWFGSVHTLAIVRTFSFAYIIDLRTLRPRTRRQPTR